MELEGPERAARITQFAETLRRTPGIRAGDVFTRDESDGFVRLYYGTYYRKMDTQTRKRTLPAQLQSDVELVKQLGDDSGRRYFVRAMMVPMPQAEAGNPSWNLAAQRAAYSLQVAVFEPSNDFWECKQAAGEYCAYLRKKGYEAYYHHSSASSAVTVGLFGPDAVIGQPQGLPRYSAAVLALQDDELLKYNRLNGAIYYTRDEKANRVAMPSRLVEIPQRPAGGP